MKRPQHPRRVTYIRPRTLWIYRLLGAAFVGYWFGKLLDVWGWR